MKQEYLSTNFYQTKKLGEKLGQQVLEINKCQPLPKIKIRPKKTAIIIALEGELGSGKTIFVQGFAKGLGIEEKILSPTFIIMKKFKIRGNSYPNLCKFVSLYHIDCYRIRKAKEILDLNFNEIIFNPQNIVIIEWAERIRKIIPNKAVWVKFKFINKNTRKIVITNKQLLPDMKLSGGVKNQHFLNRF